MSRPERGHWWRLPSARNGRDYGSSPKVIVASIKAPTLVIVGDQDAITPEHSVALFRAIPDAQLCVLPDTGHGALPKETILTFLKEPHSSEP